MTKSKPATQLTIPFDTAMRTTSKDDIAVIDLFCGIGGVTHGFRLEGFEVVAGIDIDKSCRYAYEHNNPGSKFVEANVATYERTKIAALYPPDKAIRVMIGCAPCQPFSTNNSKRKKKVHKDEQWELVAHFGNVISVVLPDIVSMENVPNLASFDEGKVLEGFLTILRELNYHVSTQVVRCADYGVPQTRKRLVILASRYGDIRMLPGPVQKGNYATVKETIGTLPVIEAGSEFAGDPLHKARHLDDINHRRIISSLPGGTWEDWPVELRAGCHTRESGTSYKSVYGRMEWEKPAPTITAQFYAYGSGRFGHPVQNRALSLREGALLQTFPENYQFVAPGNEVSFSGVGTHIGNAVPVVLARWIAKSIANHLGVG